MDRSTQVSFPTTLLEREEKRRRMKRHNTSAEINLSVRGGFAGHGGVQRPKSLNLSAEGFHKNKILGSLGEAGVKVVYPAIGETAMYQINGHLQGLRERTPQYVSSTNNHKKSKKHFIYDTDCSTSQSSLRGCCRCWDVENASNCQRVSANTTPEGLSWRRLHMSRAKLKATATTSELLSGFAMVAMVELQINEPTNVPEWLFVMFAVCTTVLVAVHIFALMISTYILPNIDAIAKLEVCEMVTESPHERMRGFIELAWAFSTVLGLFLFLVEVAILCWVKFWDYSFTAAIAATVIVIPVLVTFILFAVHFYHSLVVHRCDTSLRDMETLEDMKKHLDQASNPV